MILSTFIKGIHKKSTIIASIRQDSYLNLKIKNQLKILDLYSLEYI